MPEYHPMFTMDGNRLICRGLQKEAAKQQARSDQARLAALAKHAQSGRRADAPEPHSPPSPSPSLSSSPSPEKSSDTRPEPPPPDIGFTYDAPPGQGKLVNIQSDDIARWKKAYPAVDVLQDLRIAEQWLDVNRSKRKKNVRRFLTNWLSRTQERGGTRSTGQSEAPDKPPTMYELQKKLEAKRLRFNAIMDKDECREERIQLRTDIKALNKQVADF